VDLFLKHGVEISEWTVCDAWISGSEWNAPF